MKTVLLLAFLALGPALADQTPLSPTFYRPLATVSTTTGARLRSVDRVAAQLPLSVDERARLCRGGT